ncbi:MAG: hypothetical protein ACE5GN_04930 [Waddliaceae bacterium]
MSVPPLGSSEQYQSPQESTCFSTEENHPEPEEAKDGFMFRSIVVIDEDNLGGVYSRNCRFFGPIDGDWYLVPNKQLTSSKPKIDLEGYPSKCDSRENYFLCLDNFKGETEKLPSSFLDNLLNNIEINVPGSIKILAASRNRESVLPQQVEVDISRFSSFTFNDQLIYDKERQDHYSSSTPFSIFQILLAGFNGDEKSTTYLIRLLTQASIGRPCEILWRKFANDSLLLILTGALRNEVYIHTYHKKGTKDPWVEVRFELLFGIRDISEQDRDGSPPIIRYIKVIRKMLLEQSALQSGTSRCGEIQDVYSPFFKDKISAEDYKLEPEKEKSSSYCTVM